MRSSGGTYPSVANRISLWGISWFVSCSAWPMRPMPRPWFLSNSGDTSHVAKMKVSCSCTIFPQTAELCRTVAKRALAASSCSTISTWNIDLSHQAIITSPRFAIGSMRAQGSKNSAQQAPTNLPKKVTYWCIQPKGKRVPNFDPYPFFQLSCPTKWPPGNISADEFVRLENMKKNRSSSISSPTPRGNGTSSTQ